MKTLASMWPRVVELLLLAGLATAPWLLDAPSVLRWHDGAWALLGLAVTLAAMARPQRRFNLLNLAVGLWLCTFALTLTRSMHEPTAQSELLFGLVLAMFSIIPSRSMRVPADWRRFFEEHPEAAEEERIAVARRSDAD